MNKLQYSPEKQNSEFEYKPSQAIIPDFSLLRKTIIFKIFLNFTTIQDLVRVERVCKRFNAVQSNPFLLQKVINCVSPFDWTLKVRKNCLISTKEKKIALRKIVPEHKLKKYFGELLKTNFTKNNYYITFPYVTKKPEIKSYSRYIYKADEKIKEIILLSEEFTSWEIMKDIHKIEMERTEIKVNTLVSFKFERWGWSAVNCMEDTLGIVNVKMKSIILKVKVCDDKIALTKFFKNSLMQFPDKYFVTFPYYGVSCYMFKINGTINMCYDTKKTSTNDAKMITVLQNEYTEVKVFDASSAKQIKNTLL